MSQIKMGIIGCGSICAAHCQGLTTLSEMFRVVAACDTERERAEGCALQFPGAKVYTDYRALLDESDAEAVDILLPHALHRPTAVDCLQAGKHVLVEKPIATTLEDADAMIEAARTAGRKLMVAFNERFDPQYQKVKEAVENKLLGDLTAARADHNQFVGVGANHWIASRQMMGGGALIGSGIHRVDLLLWIAGDVRRVCQLQATRKMPFEGEDVSMTLLEFRNGAFGEISTIWCTRRAPWYEFMIIYGTAGSIHNLGGVHIDSELLPECAGGYVRLEAPEKHSFTEELRHFGQCLLEDRQPLTSGEEARKSLEVVLAAYRSADKQRWIELPLSGL
jgi:predicted dehydrogenase